MDEIKPVDKPSLPRNDCGVVLSGDPDHRFTGLPICVAYIDGVRWELKYDASYMTAAKELSTVRKGFITDFASVPKIFWPIMPPAGDGSNVYGIAALWHDWLYSHKQIYGRNIVRKEADDLFLEIMLYTGVNTFVAHVMWSQVRMWGWVVW